MILDLLNAPWAITREKLLEVHAIYDRWAAGERADLPAVEASLGRKLDNQQPGYTTNQGVATLPIVGVMSKRMNLMQAISGGVSTQLLQQNIQQALDDPNVHSIVLAIDSPGGAVDGTQALGDQIFAARGKKPIVAVIDGVGASAAYWAGSAADRVYIVDDTTAVGSIGVLFKHVDTSERDAQRGLKTEILTAGKYKAAITDGPLTDIGRMTIQDRIDHVYSIFVDDVARNLGVSVDAVLKDMADGRVFLGKKAIDAGLVHGMASMNQVIAELIQQQSDSVIGAHAGRSQAARVASATDLGTQARNLIEDCHARTGVLIRASEAVRILSTDRSKSAVNAVTARIACLHGKDKADDVSRILANS